MKKLLVILVKLFHIRWVIITNWTEDGEIGLKIGPVILGYYKWKEPQVFWCTEYREMRNREFGDYIHYDRVF